MMLRFFADILAPRTCVGCGAEGSWCCGECLESIERDSNATCLGCARLSPGGRTCDRCRPTLLLHGALAVARYDDRIIQKVIQTTKYAPAHDAAGVFASIIKAFLRAGGIDLLRQAVGERPFLVPVPLHWKREAWRGFNQSCEIARALAAAGIGTMAAALQRPRSSVPQVGLPHQARHCNVSEVFECAPSAALLSGQAVLLIDDVMTTGATMAACARELRQSGVRSIWGFAIARG